MQDSDAVSFAVIHSTELMALEFSRGDPDPSSYQEWATNSIPDAELRTARAIAHRYFEVEPALTSLVLIHHLCEKTNRFETLPVTALFWSDDGRCKGVVAPKQKLLEPCDTSIFSRTDLMLSTFLSPDHQHHIESLSHTLSRIGVDMTDDDDEMSDGEMSSDEMSDDEMSDDEMSDDEMSDDEPSGDEPSGDEPSDEDA